MFRRDFVKTSLAAGLAPFVLSGAERKRSLDLMDMVHFNPGEPPPQTDFLNPAYLRQIGIPAQVIQSPIEGVATFDDLAPNLIPAGSPGREWSNRTQAAIQQRIHSAHDAGLKVYGWMQLVVLPKPVLAHFRDDICDAEGHIDVERSVTRNLIGAQLSEIIERFPLLDGLVIRTGEVYLQNLPYHASTGNAEGTQAIQRSTAILHDDASHIALLEVLRSVVCVQLNRKVFYRTWDYGKSRLFHTSPEYYLSVTDRIAPHPNLAFSIKHQAGDFHQLTPFNPTLTLGKHPQVVEVQCQREAYGKGAHPYYIGRGVIEGWEDMAWVNPPGRPKGLRDILGSPVFQGVWTWSRGGGWEGPYIKNEFWCRLNTLVMTEWTRNPSLPEPVAFSRATEGLGVPPQHRGAFRKLNLLATSAVLRGQLTAIPTSYKDPIRIDVWWARDDKLDNPDLSDFVRCGLVERSILEKQQAVAMWREIVALAEGITLASPEDTAFVRSSCRYGYIKYSVIAAGWTATLLAQAAAIQHAPLEKSRIAAAIRQWDQLWDQWKQAAAADPLSSTLVRPQAFDIDFKYRPGLGAAVDDLRRQVDRS